MTLSALILLWVTAPALAVDMEHADKLVHQWLDTEHQVSLLEKDWQVQKPYLTQRVSLLKAEKQQLRKMIAENNQGQNEVEEQRAALLLEQTEMEAQQTELGYYLETLSKKLQSVSALLPPPLQESWQDEQAVLAETPEAAVQLQVALAQLSKLADFNQRIGVHEMLIQSPNGDDILVKQLYLGVGAAWFSNKDGSYAGIGRATPEGWSWQFDESINSQEIVKAITIFEKQQEADFVRLPLRLNSAVVNE